MHSNLFLHRQYVSQQTDSKSHCQFPVKLLCYLLSQAPVPLKPMITTNQSSFSLLPKPDLSDSFFPTNTPSPPCYLHLFLQHGSFYSGFVFSSCVYSEQQDSLYILSKILPACRRDTQTGHSQKELRSALQKKCLSTSLEHAQHRKDFLGI